MKTADELRAEAARWLARREHAGFDAADRAVFDEWRAAPECARAFAEVERTWRRLDNLAAYPRPSRAAADADLLAPAASPLRRVRAPLLAAAAALAVLAAAWWWTAAPRLADGAETLAAATETRAWTLGDGSEVELAAGSAVEVRMAAGERRLRLRRGAAHFAVRPDTARPFVVEAGGVAVRAVGTAFSVREAEARLEVIVTEGAVALRRTATDAAEYPLRAGQRARLDAAGTGQPEIDAPTTARLDDALGWLTGRLIFDETPLPEVIRLCNRYAAARGLAGRLRLGDPELAHLRLSGRIVTGGVNGVVEVLGETLDVVAIPGEAGDVVLRRR